MAKVHVFARMPDNLALEYLYGAPMQIGTHTTTSAVFAEASADGGDQIIFLGARFLYDGDALVGGHVHGVSLLDERGKPYLTINDLDLEVAQFSAPTSTDPYDPTALIKMALGGDDHLKGSNSDDSIYGYMGKDVILARDGADWINGGRGNDTLTGDAGSDFFEFSSGSGHDVITDFDANGGADKQDFISLNASQWNAHQDGHDVIVEFGDGDTIRLLDTHRSQISDADIFLTFEG